MAERYPYSLRSALQKSRFENILDSNMFTAYIPRDTGMPRFIDPRKSGTRNIGTYRLPGHVHSTHINQVFSCIGYIKRVQNLDYLKYLPMLYEELGRFLAVMEDIAYNMDIILSMDIYEAHKRGYESFLNTYHARRDRDAKWIDGIRKHQMIYLEKIDMLIEALKARGKIFDLSGEPLYTKIVSVCREFTAGEEAGPETSGGTGCRFIANCCTKAAMDGRSKMIWSGDIYILKLLKHIYTIPGICGAFPQIYLRSSYDPMNFAELFPKWHPGKNEQAQGPAPTG